MVYSLFSCHKCAHWSHPILSFLTFHKIDLATNVPSVLFTQEIFGSWLYLLMPFYYRYDRIHICRVWYELFEKNQMKYYTLFRVLRWEFSSVYFAFDKTYISGNITHECIKLFPALVVIIILLFLFVYIEHVITYLVYYTVILYSKPCVMYNHLKVEIKSIYNFPIF